jgi:hypothetical protein
MLRKFKGLKSISAFMMSIAFFFAIVMSSCGGTGEKATTDSDETTEKVEEAVEEHSEGEEHPSDADGEEHPTDSAATQE